MSSKPPKLQLDQLIPEVYQKLRDYASRALSGEQANHSLQTTEIVHETYLRLSQLSQLRFQSPDELLRAAIGTIRRVLIDHARQRKAKKRSADQVFLQSPAGQFSEKVEPMPLLDLMALDEALQRLEELDPRKAEIVELRYFGGQDLDATARIMGISVATVKRDWTLAKAWLFRELNESSIRA